jgi:hypothetical protein
MEMIDTDWRPSPCPDCGEYRAAAKNPVCLNPNCPKSKGTRKMKTEQKYIWMDAGEYFKGIVTDLEKLFRDPSYDTADKLYELGPEVKLEMSVKAILKNPVFRSGENKE